MKVMEIQKLQQFNEARIARFKKSVSIVVDMESTIHSVERQSRHGDLSGEYIEQQEIVELMEMAIDDISKLLMFDKINIGDKFVITDTQNDLNVVVATSGVIPNLKLIAVTVMRKNKFTPNRGQYHIKY